MTLWQKINLPLYLFWTVLIASLLPSAHIHAKWFDDLKDIDSLKKYCIAKARSYEVRAQAFNEGSWGNRQYARLHGLWQSLPSLYDLEESEWVHDYNIALKNKKLEFKKKLEEEIDFPQISQSSEEHPVSKIDILNGTIDDILEIKKNLTFHKLYRPYLLRTEALTEGYSSAKAAQYQALFEATRADTELSSLYLELSKAWGRSQIDQISLIKIKIRQLKSNRSPYKPKVPETQPHSFLYRKPSIFIEAFLLSFITISCPNYSSQKFFQKPTSTMMGHIKIPKESETIRKAGEYTLILEKEVAQKLSMGSYWWFGTHKNPVTKEHIKMWKNHLFYRDAFSSTLGITTDEASLVIEELVL
ncbi:hypothetical protein Bealeia1_01611 [Candidatus Bealeia paramacronuclearis]|uniref:YARHG domain-containing protein n=1 Tax=Candidatus Bealeia paramacronuclearis TaxID=1921001 RepID=A0ABZ2CA32_9PROT|nr:hypothetical protein [Candidatus Bealeia paramacronuclearis]